MEKKCFVIMPLSEPDGYPQGHFERVYQYIVVPACRQAGLSPIRAFEPLSSDSAKEVLINMVECDIAICDLSTKDPNALYALAMRHAMSLPVTVTKDMKTYIGFDITEFGTVEYDESLRIDTVQKEVGTLSDMMTKTLANKLQRMPLLERLHIGAEQHEPAAMSLEDTKKEESHLPVISPLPDYVGDPIREQDDIDKLKVGGFIFHMNYGKGEIISINKMSKDRIAKVQFDSGSKLLVLAPSGIWRKIV